MSNTFIIFFLYTIMDCEECHKGFITETPKYKSSETTLMHTKFCSNALCDYSVRVFTHIE